MEREWNTGSDFLIIQTAQAVWRTGVSLFAHKHYLLCCPDKRGFCSWSGFELTHEMEEEEDAGQPPRKSLHLWGGSIFLLGFPSWAPDQHLWLPGSSEQGSLRKYWKLCCSEGIEHLTRFSEQSQALEQVQSPSGELFKTFLDKALSSVLASQLTLLGAGDWARWPLQSLPDWVILWFCDIWESWAQCQPGWHPELLSISSWQEFAFLAFCRVGWNWYPCQVVERQKNRILVKNR